MSAEAVSALPVVTLRDFEKRAHFLVQQAIGRALDSKESYWPDGQLDIEMFEGLLADFLAESVLKPLVSG